MYDEHITYSKYGFELIWSPALLPFETAEFQRIRPPIPEFIFISGNIVLDMVSTKYYWSYHHNQANAGGFFVAAISPKDKVPYSTFRSKYIILKNRNIYIHISMDDTKAVPRLYLRIHHTCTVHAYHTLHNRRSTSCFVGRTSFPLVTAVLAALWVTAHSNLDFPQRILGP